MPANADPIIPRVERRHRLIEELRARTPNGLTSNALAERLGVTTRTIERDLAELQEAGIPLWSRSGPGGGHRIDARRELPPIALTPGEAAALLAALAAIGPPASASAQSAGALIAELCGREPTVDTERATAHVTAHDGAGLIPPIVRTLQENHLPVQEITMRRPTLEDIYLAVTGSLEAPR